MSDTWRYRVTIRAHCIAGRYDVPRSERLAAGDSKAKAMLTALQYAHMEVGVPPWKPYLRESWQHVSAVRHIATKEERMRERASA